MDYNRLESYSFLHCFTIKLTKLKIIFTPIFLLGPEKINFQEAGFLLWRNCEDVCVWHFEKRICKSLSNAGWLAWSGKVSNKRPDKESLSTGCWNRCRYSISATFGRQRKGTTIKIELFLLCYYMRNFCNLIDLEQWHFSLI